MHPSAVSDIMSKVIWLGPPQSAADIKISKLRNSIWRRVMPLAKAIGARQAACEMAIISRIMIDGLYPRGSTKAGAKSALP